MNGVESEQIIIILGFLVVGLIVFFAAQKLKKTKLKELEQKLNEVEPSSDSQTLKDGDESGEADAKADISQSPAEEEDALKDQSEAESIADKEEVAEAAVSQEPIKKRSLNDGLKKTREGFIGKLVNLFKAKDTEWDDLEEDIEEVLYKADLGVKTTTHLMAKLEEAWIKKEFDSAEGAKSFLQKEISGILKLSDKDLFEGESVPHVVMVSGVNGVGKTTTIGKLALMLKKRGKSVMLAAGDTFRAAAVDQLQTWADRSGVSFMRGQENGDPASVCFDAIGSAKAKEIDIVLADTAGRLHTQVNLMEELKKVKRVMNKAHEGAPHKVILVLDANTGQNAIKQAEEFHKALGLDGLVITKLDGTAKGGVVVGICYELDLPIYYIGVGEGVEDLREFKAEEFARALFDDKTSEEASEKLSA